MTSIERRPSLLERLRPGNWSLSTKLIAVVAVPTILALGLGILRISDQSTTAATFDRVDQIVEIEQQVSDLIVSLQSERDEVAQFVAVGNRRDDSALQVTFGATDAARAASVEAQGDLSLLDSGTIGAQRQVENEYFRLVQLRRQVLTGANGAGDLVTQYGELIAPLLVFENALTRQLNNPQIGGLSQAVGALTEAREQVSSEEALVSAVLAQNALTPEQGDSLRSAESRLAAATDVVRSVLSADQQARYTGFTGSESTERQQLLQSVLTRGRAGLPIEVAPTTWADRSAAVLSQIDEAVAGARGELRAVSAQQQEAAANRAGISSVILLLALIVAAIIASLVARTLIRSLRLLRNTALDVAQRRLPAAVQSMREGAVPDIMVEPVPVMTSEEVGQVARAFDAVHSQAVRLAAEQATLQAEVSSMFTNLSRRSQTLVERQLLLIEQLESNEEDPDQLSNLFLLDHLATRMRRNSENLLVLSGSELARGTSAPVPLVDVLRATVSEVEQYQRVVVQAPPQLDIIGRAATDLVHLLSELLDNATNFSAPDTQVVISTNRGPDGSVRVAISDQGVGMTDAELSEANGRLEGVDAMDLSASRRMGLFVVGRLAARNGLRVRLGGDGPVAGMTASVVVPASLFVVTGAAPAGAAPDQAPQRGAAPERQLVPPQRDGSIDPESAAAPALPAEDMFGTHALRVDRASAPTKGAPLSALNGHSFTDGQPATNGRRDSADNGTGTGTGSGLPVRNPGELLRKPSPDPDPAAPGPRPRVDGTHPGGAVPNPVADRDTTEQQPNGTAPAGAADAPSIPTDEPAALPPRTPAGSDGVAPSEAVAATEALHVLGSAVARPSGGPRPAEDRNGTGVPTDVPAATEPPATEPPATEPPATEPQATEPPITGPPPAPTVTTPTVTTEPVSAEQAVIVPAADREKVDASDADSIAEGSGRAGPADRVPQVASVNRSPAAPNRDEPVDPGTADLFAPAAPASAQLLPRREETGDSGFDLGETTPIFEEVASAWFRSNRLLPVAYDAPVGRSDSPPHTGERAPGGSGPDSAGPGNQVPVPPTPAAKQAIPPSRPAPSRPAPPPRPNGTGPASARPASNGAPPIRPTPTRRRHSGSLPVAPAGDFATSADEGWRASAAVAEPGADEVTPAGLPKRRPRARLVPGMADASAPFQPARNAEDVRGRLASYQHGVRQAREARGQREATSTVVEPDATHDDENR